MNIAVLSDSGRLPVSLADLKRQMGIVEDDFDDTLQIMLKAAAVGAEGKTLLRVVQKTLQLRLDGWPHHHDGAHLHRAHAHPSNLTHLPHPWLREIDIPEAPVRTVSAVTYLDVNAIEQTVAGNLWSWSRTPEGAVVSFVRDFVPPEVAPDRRATVRVEFVAGFDVPEETGSGDDADLICPDSLRAAILMLAEHYFDNREAIAQGAISPRLTAVETMFSHLRVYR